MMRRLLFLLISSATVLTLLGCGYALVGRGSNIPPDIQKVYLKPFENSTDRVEIDQILTRAVADELVTRQRFTILSSEEGADAVIEGTVTGFDVRPVSFDADRRGTEFEISVTAHVEMRRIQPEETLWKNDRYQFRDSYALEASELGYLDRETPAIQSAAEKFAETMVSDLLEGF